MSAHEILIVLMAAFAAIGAIRREMGSAKWIILNPLHM